MFARSPITVTSIILVGLLGLAVPVAAQISHPAPPLANLTAQDRRIYELIYQMRMSAPPDRPEEWIAPLREITEIGKPAVPALVVELDRATRDGEQRLLIMALRIIGDPRTVPALMRAVPRVALVSSDFGFRVEDEDLRRFLDNHNWQPNATPLTVQGANGPVTMSSFNRGITESIAALEAITGHTEGHDPMTAGGSGIVTDNQATRDDARAPREAFVQRWQEWWDLNRKQFVSDEEMASLNSAIYDRDLVAIAGIAKFGPLFPSGPKVTLGPVRELIVQTQGTMDAKAFVDFDTGQIYSRSQGLTPSANRRAATWIGDAGVDASASTGFKMVDQKPTDPTCSLSGVDMRNWRIDDARFDSIEGELRASDKPFDPGERGPSSNLRASDGKYPLTVLFITREGGRGVMQILESLDNGTAIKLRYRLIEGIQSKPPLLAEILAKPRVPGTMTFGPVKEATLASPLISDQPSAIDLDTGEVKPQVVEAGSPQMSEAKLDWLAEWHGDMMGLLGLHGRGDPSIQLIGLKCGRHTIPMEMSNAAWDSMSADEVVEMLGRYEERAPQNGVISTSNLIISNTKQPPMTWVFQTPDGGKGLLQMTKKDADSLTIRYKLVRN